MEFVRPIHSCLFPGLFKAAGRWFVVVAEKSAREGKKHKSRALGLVVESRYLSRGAEKDASIHPGSVPSSSPKSHDRHVNVRSFSYTKQ